VKHLLLFLSITLVISCTKEKITKENINTISTADFTVKKEVVYMDEPLAVAAVDTSGLDYDYDFGDGNHSVGEYKTTHRYTKGGTYQITMSIYGKSVTKTVRVLPYRLSYQIKNSSTKYINILSYIDNYQAGDVRREDYFPGKLSDSLYSISSVGGTQHLFAASFFFNNKEYVLSETVWLQERTHRVIEITDSTKVMPRSVIGPTFPTYYLKDL
jgi:PKD repeat protein